MRFACVPQFEHYRHDGGSIFLFNISTTPGTRRLARPRRTGLPSQSLLLIDCIVSDLELCKASAREILMTFGSYFAYWAPPSCTRV
jgi:hypothetical protein